MPENAQGYAIYRLAVDPNNPYLGQVVLVSPSIRDVVGIARQKEAEATLSHLNPILEKKMGWCTPELDRLYHTEQERRADLGQRHRVAESLRTILAMLNSSHPLQEILEAIDRQATLTESIIGEATTVRVQVCE